MSSKYVVSSQKLRILLQLTPLGIIYELSLDYTLIQAMCVESTKD